MSQPPDNLEPQQPDVNSIQQADSFTSQNVVQGNQNRAVQGNDNQAVLGDNNTVVQGSNNLMLTIKELILGQQTTPVGDPARPKNERILLAAVKEEITARLRQSLHNTVLINLGKESQPQQVKRPWDAEIKIGLKPAEPLPDTTTILEVFDSQEIAGKLLILGAPGVGKTTTQLELAQALVSYAEEQPDYPVPILFNLSSWKDDRQSLADWLVTELKSKYGVSTKLGKEWVVNHQLLPLLDGLDELEPQRQESCVQAINHFLAGENRPLYLVVCSRSEEYSNYFTQLQLNGAIYLQPLTNNQICDYLIAVKHTHLWQAISSDLDLLVLVKTPLFLSITVIASQEISVESWQHLTCTADRIQYLLDTYIGRMLARNINSRADIKNKTPNAIKTVMWLVWLARKMQEESRTEFLIEEIQPSFLKNKNPKFFYNLIFWVVIQMLIYGLFQGLIYGATLGLVTGLFTGLTLGLFTGLFTGLIYGLIYGFINGLIGELIENKIDKYIKLIPRLHLKIGTITKIIKVLIIGLIVGLTLELINISLGDEIKSILSYLEMKIVPLEETGRFSADKSDAYFEPTYGLIVGLINNFLGDEIKTVETIRFSLKKSSSGLIFGLIFGLISGLARDVGLINRLSFGLIYGLIFGLIFGLISGICGQEIENKTLPNQGIRQSVINTVIISAVTFLIAILLIFVLAKGMGENTNVGLVLIFSLAPLGLFLGLLIAIPRSGTPAIKHFVLRIILWSNGYAPWNYAKFLDYCTNRLFLQRVGGRYRFIHKLLQDHFAQMKFKRN